MSQTTAVAPAASIGIAGQSTPRVVSIDIFRGLTMAVMIFVNELSSVRGLPWWTYHAPGRVDRMTYVDMVFPFFLFIVGLSLPIAVRARLRRDPSPTHLALHVLLRAVSLIGLGMVLANAESASRAHMPVNGGVWALLALLGGALFLNVYPAATAARLPWLRWLGLALYAGMLAIFRRVTPAGQVAWLDFSYPEILGLIGYTYFAVCVLYLPTRRWRVAPVLWLVALTALCVLCCGGKLPMLRHTPWWVWPWENGSMALTCFAGIVTSSLFLDHHRWSSSPRARTLPALVFAAVLLAAAWLLTPWGISKIRGTPTWALASAGAAVLCFTALYWLADVKGHTRWAAPVRAAGANTLTTYLLPDVWFYVFYALGITWLDTHWRYGAPGILKTLVFTALMLALSALLTRARVRLAL